MGFVLLSAAAASAQSAPWPSEPPPRPLPAQRVTFPPYEIRTLANGMQVIAILHHEQPAVTMRLLVKAGAAQDPDGKAGTAYLVGRLLDQGTTTKGAEEIADRIDSIGGALGTGAGGDLTFANALVMKDSFSVGMDLLADVVRHPAFAPEEIDRQKQQAISALQVNAEDPDYIANTLIDRLVYGLHPYGMPGSGTPTSIAAVTPDDLRAFHRRYFVPNNIVLAIVGDLTADEAFAAAERVFGNWARSDVTLPAVTDPPPPARRIVVVDKPDAVQTEIRVGQTAIPRKHPDYVAWDLAVRILGGEGANRLHRILRSERGLTYGAEANTDARKQSGGYVAETDTRTETTGEALRLMVDELSRLQRQRVFERELAGAQEYLVGSYPLTIETPNQIATQVLNTLFYDLPVEEITTFRERVLAVSADDIQRVAQAYVRPDRLSIVLVGNASAFLPQLRAVGFTDVEVIPAAELDITAATLRRASPRSRLEPAGARPPSRVAAYAQTSAAAAPADPAATALLNRVIEAKGGLPALRAITSLQVEEDRVVQGAPQRVTVSVVYPSRFRIESTTGGATTILAYNGGAAWMSANGRVQAASPDVRADFAASVRRDTYPMLISAAEGRLSVRIGSGGAAGEQVLEVSGPGFTTMRLFVDANARVARQTYTSRDPLGREVMLEESFSDYRRVDGVEVPYRATVRANGAVILERTVRSIRFNVPLADSLFQQPL